MIPPNQNDPLQIFDLNDKCLIRIFSFLSFADLVSLSAVSDRFHLIIGYELEKHHFVLENEKNAYDAATRLFATYGANVKSVALCVSSTGSKQYVSLLQDRCSHLEKLVLYCPLPPFPINFFENLKNLRHLLLEYPDLTDGFCLSFSSLPFLQSLRLRGGKITGKYLCRLTQLTDLDLAGSTQLDTGHFVEILRVNKNLRKLDVSDGCPLKPIAFLNLIATQKCLDTLIVDSDAFEGTQLLPYLPKLRHVRFIESMYPLYRVIQNLSKHHSDSLEVLECIHWSRKALFKLPPLENLTKLVIELGSDLGNTLLRRVAVAWPRLEEVTILSTEWTVQTNDLLEFVRLSKNLRYLDLDTPNQCSIQIYREIVKIRKRNRNRKTLWFHFGTDESFQETYRQVQSWQYFMDKDVVRLAFLSYFNDMYREDGEPRRLYSGDCEMLEYARSMRHHIR